MNFQALTAGQSVFVDANVIVYWAAGDQQFGAECTKLLERIESGELPGYLSAAVLNDAAYRLMTLDVCENFGWPYAGIGKRLQRHPDRVKQLTRFRTAVRTIATSGIHVLPVTQSHVLRGTELTCQHGLLSNDSLILAVMESQNLSILASNDAAFDRVPTITRFGPV